MHYIICLPYRTSTPSPRYIRRRNWVILQEDCPSTPGDLKLQISTSILKLAWHRNNTVKIHSRSFYVPWALSLFEEEWSTKGVIVSFNEVSSPFRSFLHTGQVPCWKIQMSYGYTSWNWWQKDIYFVAYVWSIIHGHSLKTLHILVLELFLFSNLIWVKNIIFTLTVRDREQSLAEKRTVLQMYYYNFYIFAPKKTNHKIHKTKSQNIFLTKAYSCLYIHCTKS